MDTNHHSAHVTRCVPLINVDRADELELQRFLYRCGRAPVTVDGSYPDVQQALNAAWIELCSAEFVVDAELPMGRLMSAMVLEDFPQGSKEEVELFEYLFIGKRPRELVADVTNVRRWYDVAAEKFAQLAKPFVAPMADAKIYPKHFPRGSDRKDGDLRRRSCGGESILGFGVTVGVLADICREVEGEFFDRIFGASKFRGFVDCLGVIGFVSGEAEGLLAIEWTPDVVHAYPISEREYRQASERQKVGCVTKGLVTADVAQGFLVNRP